MLRQRERLDGRYDSDADVLYVSIGKPRKGVGVDIGDGVVVRYDEAHREVIGVTILGMRERLADRLTKGTGNGRRKRR